MFGESYSLQALLRPPVVLYLRVSSDKQREAQTIDGQRAALVDFLEREGISVSEVYVDDGLNGDLPWTDRPGARQLLIDAAAGKFRTVMLYLYDRFSRNLLEGLLAARSLKTAGVAPVSLLEPFDIRTPFGEYMFAQSLNNAQLWKAQFLEKTRNGQRRKAEQGAWQSGTFPYGYRIVGKKGNARIEPAENIEALPGISEAEIVRQMFRFVGEEGKTCVWVAKYLNALGVPSPLNAKGFDKATYGKWFYNTVSTILHNTVYKGVVQYGKETRRRAIASGLPRHDEPLPKLITSSCPALVSVELWDRTQHCITHNQIDASRNRKREYALRGKIKCANCGSTYIATTSVKGDNSRTVYRCSLTQKARTHDLVNPGCIGKIINGDHLMQMIQAEVDNFFASPGELVEEIARRYRELEDEKPAIMDVAAFEAALAAKEQEKQNILTLFRRNRISMQDVDKQLDAIEEEVRSLKEQVEAARDKSQSESLKRDGLKTAVEYIADVAANYSGFPEDVLEQRDIINALVERITIHTMIDDQGKKQATAKVLYRFHPPDAAVKNAAVIGLDVGTVTPRNSFMKMQRSGRIGEIGSRSSKISLRQ